MNTNNNMNNNMINMNKTNCNNKKTYETVNIQFNDFKEEKIEAASVSMGTGLPGDENINVDDLF